MFTALAFLSGVKSFQTIRAIKSGCALWRLRPLIVQYKFHFRGKPGEHRRLRVKPAVRHRQKQLGNETKVESLNRKSSSVSWNMWAIVIGVTPRYGFHASADAPYLTGENNPSR